MKKNFYTKKNKIYLDKNINKKEYFELIFNYLKNKKSKLDILDVGCASGDFLYLLSKNKKFSLSGIDFSKDLLKVARKKVPDAKFQLCDIRKKISLKKKFDMCTCLGTLSIFDNNFEILDKLLNLVKKGGEIIIFNPINEYDVNVLVRFQNNFKEESTWQSGLNTFSKKYWHKKLKKNYKIKSFSFQKFNIKTKIKKNTDPMRSWTLPIKNSNQIMVGTGQLLNFYIVKIKLK